MKNQTLLVSMDVTSLYLNVLENEGMRLQSIRKFLKLISLVSSISWLTVSKAKKTPHVMRLLSMEVLRM